MAELIEENCRPQIGEKTQLFSKTQKGALGALISGKGIPFPPSNSSQHNGIAGLAHFYGFPRKASSGGIDGRASGQDLGVFEVVVIFFSDPIQDSQSLGGDFGADPVSGDDCYFVIHNRISYLYMYMPNYKP